MTSLRSTTRPMGLPSNPRARSASRPRVVERAEMQASPEPTRGQRTGNFAPSSSRSLRPQRSMVGVESRSQPASPSSAFIRRPPLPELSSHSHSRTFSRPAEEERVPRRDSSRDGPQSDRARSRLRGRPPIRPAQSTASSPVSDNSSLFDRPQDHSTSSSTRTSLDSGFTNKVTSSKNAMPYWVGNDEDYVLESGDSQTNATSGLGAMLWSRVVDAAGALTVSMGQAWAANVPVNPGEVTPPGGESHLTRTMKAYHLSKAKSQSDLPDWLFTEAERGVRATQRALAQRREREDRYDDAGSPPDLRNRQPIAGRGVGTSLSVLAKPLSSSRSEPDLARTPTKAGERLRAIRDAKRNPTTTIKPTSPNSHRNNEQGHDANDRVPQNTIQARKDAPLPARPPVRVGLPSRPGAARRV